MMLSRLAAILAVLTHCCALGSPAGHPQGVDARAAGWTEKGAVDRDEKIKLSFWIKLTHTHELKEMLHRVSDPTSPEYGQYLSKAQVDALTRPKAENVAVVKSALAGYPISSLSDDAVVWANVPISFAENLLGGKFVHYCHSARDGSSNEICVLRNPTAQVPVSLRAACDIISPIDDPFPPVDPLPGPIVGAPGPSADDGRTSLLMSLAKTEQVPKAGCCFSLGYGDMMRPCCLDTKPVSDIAKCRVEMRAGGASGSTEGECPKSAKEASDALAKNPPFFPPASGAHDLSLAHPARPVTMVQPSHHEAATENLTTEHQQASAGCCYSFGYGAMMRPCCLVTHSVADVSTCLAERREGGASGYNVGQCPASAAEAAESNAKQSRTDSSKELEVKQQQKAVEKSPLPPLDLEAPSSLQLPQATEAGCCFSFGYGSRMVPCCLTTQSVSDVATCRVAQRMGGASSYSVGECPATAKEAADSRAASKAADVAAKHRQKGTDSRAASKEVAAAAQPPARPAADSEPTTGNNVLWLSVVALAACGGLVAVAAVAARRRPDWRSTPFLGGDGAE